MDKRSVILERIQDPEDRRLVAHALDRLEQSQHGLLTYVGFLDPRQRALLGPILKNSVPHCFDGGQDELSERMLCLFLPDYFADMTAAGLRELPEYPARPLKITCRAPDAKLSHRDYLGALMAQGVRRESVGDLWVTEDGCTLLVLAEVAAHILGNLDKVGNAGVTVAACGFDALSPSERTVREVRDTVASLRLDAVAGAAFGLSRTQAQDAVRAGHVTLNWAVNDSPADDVKEGDMLSMRGHGRARLASVSHVTRKGNLSVVIEKYI